MLNFATLQPEPVYADFILPIIIGWFFAAILIGIALIVIAKADSYNKGETIAVTLIIAAVAVGLYYGVLGSIVGSENNVAENKALTDWAEKRYSVVLNATNITELKSSPTAGPSFSMTPPEELAIYGNTKVNLGKKITTIQLVSENNKLFLVEVNTNDLSLTE